MSDLVISVLIDWLGPEGAVAGLEKGHLTNADLMMIARREGLDVEAKASRKQLTIELVMSDVKRVEKSADQLMQLSRDELKRYFLDRMVSNSELLAILTEMQIAPSRKIRGRMTDFAANEISDLGMYARVARGRSAGDLSSVSKESLPLPKKKG